ncbi:acetolactate synthase [bacterium SM23_31]|nr:MAG: acetolactate synthase [bacterium SM23_31]
MKASDLFVKTLEHEGIECIFGVPGEENLDLLDSIRKSKIRFIVTRHEQAAGFMAATLGRLTGRAGVCLSTLGPGATNLFTAGAYAQLGGMPMLMITGQKPIKRSKQGKFQVVDVVSMMRPITKYTFQIVNGNNIPSRIREAFRVAEEERPGAVHLELPEDIAAEETDVQVYSKSTVRRPVAEEKAVNLAVDMIEKAKHPLILIGSSANRKMTSKMLLQLIDKTGIPFFNTQLGKGVVDERHPLYLGNATLSADDYLHEGIKESDLIINVGHDVMEKPPFFMHHDGFKVIHINYFTAAVDPVYFPQVEVIGDIANGLWQINEKVKKQAHWDFSYFMKIKEKGDSRVEFGTDDNRYPIYPPRLVADVRKVMPEDGILTLDNGIFKLWFSRNYRAYAPNTVLLDNALGTMGAGLPSAIAVKIKHPDRKVIAVCGDGGFMMNSQELETAVRLKMNLVVIIIVDNAYGMIKWKQEDMGFESFGLDFGNPDFIQYAESYGAIGHDIEKAENFVPLLEECLNGEGVHVIQCCVDYSENHRFFG